ncbi:ABC transporter ATP-binding protein [Streptomyces eurocidicus]|uniref:ABC-type multidrug transport system ATPase subunit n=1 Tax=Streptomyces eurocidicus TaxID=66423 RepID=A0A7W8F274_STREU|nr:ABC transporter ATP-binding protein [Streptomyces eurocidicus]MBB5119222.1 ABC-type multidrug transport system ATPase subunit [Streptomyces eurocidicus]MBF6053190.1 ATP-binding cassette domain-containing protein [Streptomyces eurocidicus]
MPGRPPALHVRDVHKSYRSRHVLRGVSFDLEPGTLTGVVGENGAGKSTLLRILSGQSAADGGEAVVRGTLGHCPQEAVLNDCLTVAQHLRYFRVAYGLPDTRRAEELLEELRFGEYRYTRAGELSGGTRQKLNLTLALMHDPEVLLLDEPYQGFDWETYLRFWQVARRLRERGRCVLVVSHLAWDTGRLDRLYRLHDGAVRPWCPAPVPEPSCGDPASAVGAEAAR